MESAVCCLKLQPKDWRSTHYSYDNLTFAIQILGNATFRKPHHHAFPFKKGFKPDKKKKKKAKRKCYPPPPLLCGD